jgi:hypothetical protein
MAETKPKFRDELDKFAQTNFGEPISKLKETQRSDALTLGYLLKIRNELLPGSVPDEFEELHEYITDAQNDRTVDFIFRDNNHVTIVQSKHRASDKNEHEAEFDSFRN